ncbi:pyruvate dehydrogenase complex subunit PDH-E3II, partial [Toxoplasma gondii p89]
SQQRVATPSRWRQTSFSSLSGAVHTPRISAWRNSASRPIAWAALSSMTDSACRTTKTFERLGISSEA